jgi:hypothetical protein
MKRLLCLLFGHDDRETHFTKACRDFYGWHFVCERCGRFRIAAQQPPFRCPQYPGQRPPYYRSTPYPPYPPGKPDPWEIEP